MAEKPDQPSASDSDTEPLFKLFTIVEVKYSYSYVVPSFPVFAVNLRHIKYQMTDENGQVQTFDGFIRECPSLKRSYPAIVRVEIGSKFAFLVKVNSSIYKMALVYVQYIIIHYMLPSRRADLLTGAELPFGDVLVIWKFSWYDWSDENINTSDDEHESDENESVHTQSIDTSEEIMTDGDEPICTHTITFKCIGSVKDAVSQEVLSKASVQLNEGSVVPVRLAPEPNNPKDCKAIAFECCIDDRWQRTDYIVREVLDSVHCALSESKITSVEFDWIKYIVYWYNSGPGWYAGIKITRKGTWSVDVVRSKSKIHYKTGI